MYVITINFYMSNLLFKIIQFFIETDQIDCFEEWIAAGAMASEKPGAILKTDKQ